MARNKSYTTMRGRALKLPPVDKSAQIVRIPELVDRILKLNEPLNEGSQSPDVLIGFDAEFDVSNQHSLH